jgi:hypothetical protein
MMIMSNHAIGDGGRRGTSRRRGLSKRGRG